MTNWTKPWEQMVPDSIFFMLGIEWKPGNVRVVTISAWLEEKKKQRYLMVCYKTKPGYWESVTEVPVETAISDEDLEKMKYALWCKYEKPEKTVLYTMEGGREHGL